MNSGPHCLHSTMAKPHLPQLWRKLLSFISLFTLLRTTDIYFITLLEARSLNQDVSTVILSLKTVGKNTFSLPSFWWFACHLRTLLSFWWTLLYPGITSAVMWDIMVKKNKQMLALYSCPNRVAMKLMLRLNLLRQLAACRQPAALELKKEERPVTTYTIITMLCVYLLPWVHFCDCKINKHDYDFLWWATTIIIIMQLFLEGWGVTLTIYIYIYIYIIIIIIIYI